MKKLEKKSEKLKKKKGELKDVVQLEMSLTRKHEDPARRSELQIAHFCHK